MGWGCPDPSVPGELKARHELLMHIHGRGDLREVAAGGRSSSRWRGMLEMPGGAGTRGSQWEDIPSLWLDAHRSDSPSVQRGGPRGAKLQTGVPLPIALGKRHERREDPWAYMEETLGCGCC